MAGVNEEVTDVTDKARDDEETPSMHIRERARRERMRRVPTAAVRRQQDSDTTRRQERRSGQ